MRFCILYDPFRITSADTRAVAAIKSAQICYLGDSFGTVWLSSVNLPSEEWTAGIAENLALDSGTGSTINLIGDNVLICDAAVRGVNAKDRLEITISGAVVLATQLFFAGVSGTEIEFVNPITALIPNGSTISVVFVGQR